MEMRIVAAAAAAAAAGLAFGRRFLLKLDGDGKKGRDFSPLFQSMLSSHSKIRRKCGVHSRSKR